MIGASRAPDEVAFVITMAGPTIPVLEQVADDRESELRCDGLSEERVLSKRAKYERRVARFSMGHLRVIRDYDPAADLRKVMQPTLAIFAEQDALVWPDKNATLLQSAFEESGNRELWLHIVAGANHAFLLGGKCGPLKLQDGPPMFRDAIRDAGFWEVVRGWGGDQPAQ